LCDLLNENDDGDDEDDNDNDNDNDNDCHFNGCVVLPMDGYHFSLEKLHSMKNPEDVIYRRGAPDTFDVTALNNDLHKIKYGSNSVSTTTTTTSTTIDPTITDPTSNVNTTDDASSSSMIVRIPGFDHAIGDPIPNVHIFDRNKHNIVIMEGLYLLLHQNDDDDDDDDDDDNWNDDDDWNGVHKYFDETIYLDIELNRCIERLKKRNLCLPGYNTPEEIYERVDKVDRHNAIIVQKTKHRADTIVIGYK
jgi:pantothenate kinase